MNHSEEFDKNIYNKARQKMRNIGIGILHPDEASIDSLYQAQQICNVHAFGVKVDNINNTITSRPEEDMILAVKEGKLDAIVRGQADAETLREMIVKHLNYTHSDIKDIGLVKDHFNRIFVLCPISNFQGWTIEQKVHLIKDAKKFVSILDLEVKVGVISGSRPGDLGALKILDQSYYEAEHLVKMLEKEIQIKHYFIDADKAIADNCTILIMANGMIGNQVLRTLVFLGGIKIYGAIISGINELIVESFRNTPGFYSYMEFTNALVNMKK